MENVSPPQHRFLGLTGVIISLEYVRQVIVPELEQLKHDVFHHDPDEPLILHRRDILHKKRVFKILRDSYTRLYNNGSHWRPDEEKGMLAQEFQEVLTSKELKVKPKSKNDAGLQIADILTYPSKRQALVEHELTPKVQPSFSDKICAILDECKYRRSKDGLIEGYGKKLLP